MLLKQEQEPTVPLAMMFDDHSLAQSKEDAMVLLEKVTQTFDPMSRDECDQVVRNGTVHAFAKALRHQLLLGENKLTTDRSSTAAQPKVSSQPTKRKPFQKLSANHRHQNNNSNNNTAKPLSVALNKGTATTNALPASSRAPYVAVLVRALKSILLKSSDHVLLGLDSKSDSEKDASLNTTTLVSNTTSSATVADLLAPSMPHAVNLLLEWDQGYRALRLQAMSNSIELTHHLGIMLADHTDKTTDWCYECMCPLLAESLPFDIRLDASLAIAEMVKRSIRFSDASLATSSSNSQASTPRSVRQFPLTKKDCSRLVSVLSVSAATNSTLSTLLSRQSLGALAILLAQVPSCFKMSRRRCCIMAAKLNLRPQGSLEDASIRCKALSILSIIVTSHSVENGPNSIFSSNMELIIGQTLLPAAQHERHLPILTCILELLALMVTDEQLPIGTERETEIMNVLFRLASSEETDDDDSQPSAGHRAGLCYLRAVTPFVREDPKVLDSVVELSTSHHEPVRLCALQLVQDTAFWVPKAAETLVHRTAFLENASLMMRHGSVAEQALVIQTIQHILFEKRLHPTVLNDSYFVESLCRYIMASGSLTATYVAALDVWTDFMLDPANTSYFLPHSELLPWMVALANRTSCDDLKGRLVACIRHFTTGLIAIEQDRREASRQ